MKSTKKTLKNTISGVQITKASVPNLQALERGRRAYVLGYPIQHSLSPALHRSAYDFLGEDIFYDRLATEATQLPARFGDFISKNRIVGYSVTMPLKSAIIDQLDVVGVFAQSVGAVNTVYWRELDGQSISHGHNTDVAGIVNALNISGVVREDNPAVAIIGGGNTAASSLVALKILGAHTVDIYVRTPAKDEVLRHTADFLSVNLRIFELSEFIHSSGGYSTVISTLPSGAADQLLGTTIDQVVGTLLDVAYDPWPSALATRWKELGGCVVSGKDMLLYQAIDQIKLFLGLQPSYRFSEELALVNTMCDAISLPRRDRLTTFTIDPDTELASL